MLKSLNVLKTFNGRIRLCPKLVSNYTNLPLESAIVLLPKPYIHPPTLCVFWCLSPLILHIFPPFTPTLRVVICKHCREISNKHQYLTAPLECLPVLTFLVPLKTVDTRSTTTQPTPLAILSRNVAKSMNIELGTISRVFPLFIGDDKPIKYPATNIISGCVNRIKKKPTSNEGEGEGVGWKKGLIRN